MAGWPHAILGGPYSCMQFVKTMYTNPGATPLQMNAEQNHASEPTLHDVIPERSTGFPLASKTAEWRGEVWCAVVRGAYLLFPPKATADRIRLFPPLHYVAATSGATVSYRNRYIVASSHAAGRSCQQHTCLCHAYTSSSHVRHAAASPRQRTT